MVAQCALVSNPEDQTFFRSAQSAAHKICLTTLIQLVSGFVSSPCLFIGDFWPVFNHVPHPPMCRERRLYGIHFHRGESGGLEV